MRRKKRRRARRNPLSTNTKILIGVGLLGLLGLAVYLYRRSKMSTTATGGSLAAGGAAGGLTPAPIPTTTPAALPASTTPTISQALQAFNSINWNIPKPSI